MIVIPAIDLKNGRCVRLLQGKAHQETVYSEDPPAVARRWEEAGAQRLHVVDLDGAFSGSPRNLEALKSIIAAISLPVQFGGGVRDIQRVKELMSLGVWRVILGTAAYQDKEFLTSACEAYPGSVAVGVDAKDGKMAIKGWVEETGEDALITAHRCQEAGASAIIYTDISRDGMLSGPNISATRQVARAINIPVIASGGVSSLDDIRALREMEGVELEGVIVGKALYTGDVDLGQAINAAEKG